MRRPVLTFILALVIGLALGWFIYPWWRTTRALGQIVAPDPVVRVEGWTWLEPRIESLETRIHAKLVQADPDALRDAADRLDRAERWTWDVVPEPLRLEAMRAQAAIEAESHHRRAALDGLITAPLDLVDADGLADVVATLWSAGDPDPHETLAAAAAWAGPERLDWLARIRVPTDEPSFARTRQLILSWSVLKPPTLDAAPPPAVREAWLLRRIRHAPENAGPALGPPHIDDLDAGVVSYILRFSDDPRALRALEARAEAGQNTARYALQSKRPGEDDEQSRFVAQDSNSTPNRRRLAAWRWDGIAPEDAAALVLLPPADRRGTVYACALLAERRLPEAAATEIAKGWIASFDDDEKRAGAVLSVLLGANRALLGEAYDREDQGRVRTIQRLALWGLGRRADGTDPRELAHRARLVDDGVIDGDVLLCRLRAGDADALTDLTRLLGSRDDVQARAMLVERFVPQWHALVGRPLGGSAAALRLHFDWLDARRMIMARRMQFVPATKTFRER